MGDSPKWVKIKRRREKEEERLNDGNNNGQATHGTRKHAWRTQANKVCPSCIIPLALLAAN